jgi:hypothetical protein
MSENPTETTENLPETTLPPLDAEKQAQVDQLLADLNARAKADGLGVEFSQDGANVQGKDVATGQVLEVPEAEPEPWFKCKKGHKVQGAWIHVARDVDGTPLRVSGPTCRVCWVAWMQKMFPATECAPPKSKTEAS